jgi:hypothetical protein
VSYESAMIYQSIRQMNKMLGQLDTWLVKTTEYAQKKPFDANTLLAFRLAPDQHPFVRQVQLSCDHAKFAPARLTGKEAPSHPDDEQTIDALRARIGSVKTWLLSRHARLRDPPPQWRRPRQEGLRRPAKPSRFLTRSLRS